MFCFCSAVLSLPPTVGHCRIRFTCWRTRFLCALPSGSACLTPPAFQARRQVRGGHWLQLCPLPSDSCGDPQPAVAMATGAGHKTPDPCSQCLPSTSSLSRRNTSNWLLSKMMMKCHSLIGSYIWNCLTWSHCSRQKAHTHLSDVMCLISILVN